VREFAKQIAVELAQQHPDTVTTQVSKAARKGRIFVDYLRNSYGATSVAPYSLRATESASVATPIEWHELSRTEPQSYTLKNIFLRLARKGDVWENFEKSRKKLKLGK
jgi:bifunctional non-homologous end joining protein LigD